MAVFDYAAQKLGQGVTSMPDYLKLEEEFKLKKQQLAQEAELNKAKIQQALSGGNDPAAIQIANEIQKRRMAGDEMGAQLLENTAKIYDKGIQYDPATGGFIDMRGYGAGLGNLKYGENIGGETATQQVKSAYEPLREQDIATRKADVEVSTAAEIERQKTIGRGEVTPVEQQSQSRGQVSKMLSDMKADFKKLSEMGAMVDETKGALPNIGASVGASGVGKFYGKITGDPAQTLRKQIDDAKPKLLLAIMRAGGASARGLDSDAELKQWLLTTGDTSSSIQANMALMHRLENLIGEGSDPMQASRDAILERNAQRPDLVNPNQTLPGDDVQSLIDRYAQ